MNKTQCKYKMDIVIVRASPRGNEEFALITAISILFLLTLVSIALLSLSALTVKTSPFDWARAEARANARLGLMIAIGELQRDLARISKLR